MSKFYPVAEPDIGPKEIEYVLEAVRSGWVSSLGRFIGEFEEGFASFCEADFGVSVCNGTCGLHLALVAAGIGEGDEVIIPSLTFVATAAAVIYAHATPVFVDCDDFGNIDPIAVTKAISPRTKAVIGVHLYGIPADMASLNEIAEKHDLLLMEDAAEAHGARYQGARVGSLAKIGVFSFYGNKLLTTGEGGMITTNDPELDQRMRVLRDHAMNPDRRYWHEEVGFNFRMTNLQAALGIAQLERAESMFQRRRDVIAHFRNAGLTEEFGIRFNPTPEYCDPAPWLVCAWLPSETADQRDRICKNLKEHGVDTRPFFNPLHEMPPYSNYRTVAADGSACLDRSMAVSKAGFNLPSSGNLEVEDLEYIVNAVRKSLGDLI